MPKVLIASGILAGVNGTFLTVFREAGFDVVYPPVSRQLLEHEILEQLKGVSAVLAGSEPYTRPVLEAHPQLRVVARAGVGYDAVDTEAATQLGKVVTITPGTNQEGVAEQTFALILALAKRVIPLHLATQAGKWPRQSTVPLRGRTLGIAGLGRIGKEVALRGSCFGMKLLAYEPFPDHDFLSRHKITLTTLDKILAESDFLSLHMPMTADAKHLINKKTLALMKPTAFLVNTARGGLVCEADLIEALTAKKLAGAGLDVFENEPPPPSELLHFDNVVLSPHVAGVDLQSRDNMAESAARAIADLSRGQWPAEKIVNPAVRSIFQWGDKP